MGYPIISYGANSSVQGVGELYYMQVSSHRHDIL